MLIRLLILAIAVARADCGSEVDTREVETRDALLGANGWTKGEWDRLASRLPVIVPVHPPKFDYLCDFINSAVISDSDVFLIPVFKSVADLALFNQQFADQLVEPNVAKALVVPLKKSENPIFAKKIGALRKVTAGIFSH